MTTLLHVCRLNRIGVVEAYRLDRYDNMLSRLVLASSWVVEAYRLDRYDNFQHGLWVFGILVL